MNLSELEALAKAAPQFGINFSAGVETPIYESVRVPPQTILQMIALIRQLGDALEVASDLTMPYDDCECPICKAVDAWKEFDK